MVCVGNICRSPVGERLLAAELEGVTVGSAGLGALVGHPADPLTGSRSNADAFRSGRPRWRFRFRILGTD
ncbi:hypothetical protein [Cereibacter changlensis]|uniref:arsenate reductase/protein-tyrosine-phosphatase family protein n=1 Tax=Cereibacter changlensis TaxID=402884 RepID=UPI000DAF0C0F